ncbi:tRNA dihydrouridine synthase [Leptospira ilyithenensis]|uniref:tRNA-dihydrouridine synthase n=1 Tax=Leptospira ilyithenensis TaxID=2484901 RepID=A0A4R9LPN8_9LEPT|nr:tRNA-dihydrouridine synthase family protein [Leptospira ilyithenensis]TGN10981.1 tRNA-dihydrouridine synthase family protein [Leptospira ilyithenensis]
MIKVGNVEIKGDVALSPMAGISDSPYRRITRRYGSAFSYTEFVSTEQILLGNRKSIDMFRFQEMERPISFQIFGSDLNTVVEAAKRIAPLKPDIIDLNMGCSVAKVSHHGSGAGLLRNLPLAGQMIEGIRKSVSVPVTAKIRLGWDEKNLNYKESVHILQESGVSAISVHGRTKSMAYTGKADWNSIGDIKSFAKVPIFGNGDVASFEEAKDKIKKYEVDLVLIGRKAIGNPWIFSERDKSSASFAEIKKVVIEHLLAMLDFYPNTDDYGLILFRKHFAKYVEGTNFPKDLKNQMLQTESLNMFLQLFSNYEETETNAKLETIELNDILNCETYLVDV